MTWRDIVAEHTELGETFPVGRPALMMELYGSGAALAKRAEAIYDRFVSLVPPGTELFALGSKDRQYKKVTVASERRIRKTLSEAEQSGAFYTFKSAPEFSCGQFSCEISLGSDSPLINDSVVLGLPVSWGDAADAARAVQVFEQLVSDFPFWGGIAGFGFDIVWGREFEQSAMPVNFRVAQRYHGILVRDRGMSSQLLVPAGPGLAPLKCLPSAAWLTYLGEELVEAVGGVTGLQNAVGAAVTFKSLGQGLLLRAGDAPPVVDVNRPGEDNKALALLHRGIAKVIRDRWFHTYSLLGVERDVADAWLHRFD